jgi:hypothetical protein
MLRITGQPVRHCDGVSRREFLTAGALGLGGLTLADILRAESQLGIGSSHKAIINVHLDGGPPQMDMIDMKPDAPSEVRGEFSPISTALPGFQVCELMPKLAAAADRYVFIRSLVGAVGAHNAFQCQSGFADNELKNIGGRPAVGCVVNKLLGSVTDPAPAFIDMMQGRPLVRHSARAGFLGPTYKPFRPDMNSLFKRDLEDGMKTELTNQGANHTTRLKLGGELTADRLNSRSLLLASLDTLRRDMDRSGMMDAMDHFTQQATGILLSGTFADALDLSREDPAVVEKFTADAESIVGRHVTSDEPRSSLKFLMARRLIEAGVRCVSLTISDFDTHSDNFNRMRQVLPILDHGLHALVTDLEERGMLDDVSIVLWGEFGRTPKINGKAGRDHWPRVSPAILAGGGMRTGQVLGATDRTAGTATRRPITHKDVFATLYQNIGLPADKTTIVDPSGRPHYLLDGGTPIREVV